MNLRDRGKCNSKWIIPINSAKVKKLRYIRNSRQLQVVYKNSPFFVHTYKGVPFILFKKMQPDDVSMDNYLITKIKNRFPSTKQKVTQSI